MSVWTDIIKESAEKQFGISALLPVQQLVIHNIMEALYAEEDRDYYDKQLIILPTGTGKSVCFQIPAYLSESPTIIVYPLLSLINDQLRRLQEAGLNSHKLVGAMSTEEKESLKRDLENGTCKCVLTNPESLEQEDNRALLSTYNPELVVIDESHCISKWGNTFRHSYLELGKHIECLNARVVVGFTGTASEDVIADIKRLLFLGEDMYVLRGHANRENITYSTIYCMDRERALVELLSKKGMSEEQGAEGMYPVFDMEGEIERPALVFCSTRSSCAKMALRLRYELDDENVFFYHAGLNKEEKNKIEEWFLHSKDGILVATCAYGMGVDKSDIRTVIHLEPYSDIENFLQETGRAGRDRSAAKSIMLSDLNYDNLQKDGEIRCRRELFMEALGLDCDSCTGCDICIGYYPLYEELSANIIDVVSRYPRSFDKKALVDFCIKIQKKIRPKKMREQKLSYRKLSYSEIQNIKYAVDSLCSHRVLRRHKMFWGGTLSLDASMRRLWKALAK